MRREHSKRKNRQQMPNGDSLTHIPCPGEKLVEHWCNSSHLHNVFIKLYLKSFALRFTCKAEHRCRKWCEALNQKLRYYSARTHVRTNKVTRVLPPPPSLSLWQFLNRFEPLLTKGVAWASLLQDVISKNVNSPSVWVNVAPNMWKTFVWFRF